MSFGYIVQKFLKEKLKEDNLKVKVFAQDSQIPYPTVNKIINAIQLNPDFKNILKIADYFNCTVEEVLERKNNLPGNIGINKLSLDEINNNLKNFISDKLKKYSINPYELGKNCGFSSDVIRHFIRKNNPQKTLGILVIVALADYFKVSIDEMIGRVSSSKQEPQQTAEAKKEPPDN
jgi:transcriptional regulator with XRE-family HTH domain